MRYILGSTVLVLMFGLTACVQAATPIPFTTPKAVMVAETPQPANEANQSVLKTSMGDFRIVSARFVDEVNGAKPGPGEKILLVILSRPGTERMDPSTFPLEDFDKMTHDTTNGEIYILGDDGSRSISTMGGWVNEEFAMGFRLPVSAKTYRLFWPGNTPIDIVAED